MVKLIAVVILTLGGMAFVPDSPAELITKPSERALFDGKLNVRVADNGTTTTFKITFATRTGSVAHDDEAKSADAKGWFVVAETAGRVWLYRGGEALWLLEHRDNPAGSSTSTTGFYPGQPKTAEALAKAPKSVVERLPASFKAPAKDK
jgi:hypothetical protein